MHVKGSGVKYLLKISKILGQCKRLQATGSYLVHPTLYKPSGEASIYCAPYTFIEELNQGFHQIAKQSKIRMQSLMIQMKFEILKETVHTYSTDPKNKHTHIAHSKSSTQHSLNNTLLHMYPTNATFDENADSTSNWVVRVGVHSRHFAIFSNC